MRITGFQGPLRGPLVLALAADCDLVSLGLAQMLAPYADRVRLVGPGERADITLYDPSPSSGVGRAAPGSGGDPTSQRVAWSWAVTQPAVERALADGASAYLTKQASAKELVDSLEAIRRGERVVHAAIGPTDERSEPELDWPGRAYGLTPRESEVLSAITEGLSNQEIAARCYLSINSVKSYIRACYRKIGVSSRSQAVLWGVQHGMRSPATPPLQDPLDG